MQNTKRIQFEIVELQVNEMFQACIKHTDISILEQKFSEIMEFISVCGWTQDAYTARLWGWDLTN